MSEQESPQKIEGLLGPPVGYIDLADASLAEKDVAKRAEPPKYNPLRPSAAGFCERLLAHNFAEYRGLIPHIQEEQSPDLTRLFDLGHAIEYNMIRMWGQVEIFEIKYKQQAMTFHKYGENEVIEGSNDLCVYLPGYRVIGDWKSKGDKWSSYYESKWNEIDEDLRGMASVQAINDRVYWVDDLPAFLDELRDQHFAANFIQLNLYATHEFMTERGIDHACIWQYDKNKSRLREIRFRPSSKVRDYVINKWERIIEAVDIKKDPELTKKEHQLGSMMCAFCKRKSLCWPDADAKRAFFQNLPAKDWPRDTNRLGDIGNKLEEIYSQFAEADQAALSKSPLEEKLIMTLRAADVNKVRFSDGRVYEVRFFKSPKPHFELRRTKV